jgi:hypothetical protein
MSVTTDVDQVIIAHVQIPPTDLCVKATVNLVVVRMNETKELTSQTTTQKVNTFFELPYSAYVRMINITVSER